MWNRKIASLAEMHHVRTGCHGATDLSPVTMGAENEVPLANRYSRSPLWEARRMDEPGAPSSIIPEPKALEVLMDAFVVVARELPEAQLVIGGDLDRLAGSEDRQDAALAHAGGGGESTDGDGIEPLDGGGPSRGTGDRPPRGVAPRTPAVDDLALAHERHCIRPTGRKP
mgnify:CR=1 FL=1